MALNDPRELFRVDAGLLQDAAKRSDGEFFVKGDDAAGIFSAQHHMAPTMPNLAESQSLQGTDRLLTRDPG